jgi:DNA primase
MARIPSAFIDDVLARVDIAEVIGKRITLKRKGREFSARCPFHDERTASFYVSPQKQFYHCFGCGAHGTAIGFLINYEGLDFTDAVESIASDLGLTVPYEGGGYKREDGSDALFPVLAEAALYFRQQIASAPHALQYVDKRGIDRATAERFQLGYAPSDINAFLHALGRSPERKKTLELAGLIGQGERGPYLKFKDRLMFPILDKRGRCIAFGGRILGEGEPKYLNSQETPLFKKSQELYGLYFARQNAHQRLLVVEGYMDVVSLVQFGVTEAVATLGTATSREHAELLFRSAEEVVFCFDGDRAGRQAAWRALVNTLPRMRDGRQAKFLFLPNGEDPDSLVRAEGAEAFRLRFDSAQPLSSYFFAEMHKQADPSSLDGRARLAEKAKPFIASIPDGAFAELMQQELSRLTGVRSALVSAAPEAASKARIDVSNSAASTRAGSALVRRTLVRQAIALLLAQPSAALQLQPPFAFAALDLPGVRMLMALIELARERSDVSGAVLIEQFNGQAEYPALMKLLTAEHAGDLDSQRAELMAAIEKLNAKALDVQVADLKAGLAAGTLDESGRTQLRALLARSTR